MNRHFFVVAAILTLLSQSALVQTAAAHSPYTRPQTTLEFGNGRKATLEILFGDGIFFADPGRGQLKTEDGAVVARTPTGDAVITLCPSPGSCRVFLLRGSIPLPESWRLLPEQVAWSAAVEEAMYPEFDDRPPVGFIEERGMWPRLLGTGVLLFRYAPGLAAIILPWWMVALSTGWLRALERRRTGRVLWSAILSVLAWVALAAYELLGVYILVALSAFPIALLIVLLAVAAFGLHRLSRLLVGISPSTNPS